jgi:serine/threonine-protein kinase
MLIRRGDDPDFVKVLDFGIAHLAGGDPSTATAEGLIFGTARYISPEAAQGESVGPPGDVYSIATMLYQMLAGRTPFEAEQAISLLIQQIHDAPPLLKTVTRTVQVPDRIAAVVMQNLAKRPEGRAKDGRELGQALFQAAAEEGILAPEIAVARSAPGSSRGVPSEAVQTSPKERTWHMQGGSDPGRSGDRTQGSASAMTDAHSPRSPAVTEVTEDVRRPLAVSTTRWSPAAALGLRVPARSTGLDATLDEVSPPVRRPVQPTLPAPPLSSGNLAPAVAAPSSSHGTGADNGSREATCETDPGATGGPYRGTRAWGRWWTLGLVVACFVFGALGVVLIGFRSTLSLPGAKQGPSLDAEVARANEALLHQRWDAPRGDNVRDTTDDGLHRWPHEPQLLRIRSLASADIVKAARARRDEGNVAEALRLSRLAYELDPSDGASQKLVADLEAQSQAPTMEAVPPLASAREPPSASSPPNGGARASLEVSSARPSVGQPIDFVARVAGGSASGRTVVQGPVFRVTGPGIAPGTALDAAEGGSGTYRATFAFLQPGRFDVSFQARAVDGAMVRSSRVLVVSGPPGPSASSVPAAAPSAAAPWM